jgi:NitT/TauT family transport system substrate-binding protein
MTGRSSQGGRLGAGVLSTMLLLACSGPAASGGAGSGSAAGASAGAPSGPAPALAPASVANGAAPSGAASASPGGASGTSTAAPVMRASLAYTTLSASAAHWWMAAEAGYFREQGLDAEMRFVDPGATLLAALTNGDIDLTFANGASLVIGYVEGLETMIVGGTMSRSDGGVYARAPIRTPEDLRGKTVGVSRLGSVSDTALRIALRKVGFEPDVDVRLRPSGPNAASLAALETGLIDGALLGMPTAFEAAKRGYSVPLNLGDLDVRFLNGGVGVTRRTINERPEMVDRTLRALAQAGSRLRTDRDLTIRALGKYSQIDDPELLAATVDYYQPLYQVDPYPDPEAVQRVLETEEHPAVRGLRYDDVVDTRFADRLRREGFIERLPR